MTDMPVLAVTVQGPVATWASGLSRRQMPPRTKRTPH